MKSEKKKRTSSLIALSIITVMLFIVGGTLAYLADRTPEVVNTFTPSKIETNIEEKFESNVKTNVRIQNTGDVDAYIRARIVVTWQDKNGNVLGEKPVSGTDYTMKQTLGKWYQKDGLYYYKGRVSSGGYTAYLIDRCEPLKAAPVEGYTLHVEILAEAIQADPDAAIKDAWGVTPQELGVK